MRSTFSFFGAAVEVGSALIGTASGGVGTGIGGIPAAIIVDMKCCCIISIIIEVAIGLNIIGLLGGKLGVVGATLLWLMM